MAQQLPNVIATTTPSPQPLSLVDGRAEAMLAEMAALPDGDQRRERLRAELVRMHTGYVRSVARRYAGRGEPVEDIEQAGLLGLVKSINRYDPQVGERFLAYASQVVTGEVKRHFRDRTWTIRVPRRLQELRISMREVTREFTNIHGHAPTVPETAALLDISQEELIEVVATTDAYQPASLDTPLSDGEDSSTLGDLLGDHDSDLDNVVDHAALQPMLEQLPARDREILQLRFWGNQTQSQIGDRLGISQMHVSRLLSRSLAYLRAELLKD